MFTTLFWTPTTTQWFLSPGGLLAGVTVADPHDPAVWENALTTVTDENGKYSFAIGLPYDR